MFMEVSRKANTTQSQLWFVSDVGDDQVTIANNGTGVLLTASSCKFPSRSSQSSVGGSFSNENNRHTAHAATYTQFISPANLGTHWRYSNYSTRSNALR